MAVTRSDVRQAPDCFKLELGALYVLAKLEETWDQVTIDSLLDRWVNLKGQKFPNSRDSQDLNDLLVTGEQGYDLIEV